MKCWIVIHQDNYGSWVEGVYLDEKDADVKGAESIDNYVYGPCDIIAPKKEAMK